MGGGTYAGGGIGRLLNQIRDGVEGKTAEWQTIKYLRCLYNPFYVWCKSTSGILKSKKVVEHG